MPPFSLRNLLTRGSRFSRQALHETTLPFLKALAPSASSETSARAARMPCGSGGGVWACTKGFGVSVTKTRPKFRPPFPLTSRLQAVRPSPQAADTPPAARRASGR